MVLSFKEVLKSRHKRGHLLWQGLHLRQLGIILTHKSIPFHLPSILFLIPFTVCLGLISSYVDKRVHDPGQSDTSGKSCFAQTTAFLKRQIMAHPLMRHGLPLLSLVIKHALSLVLVGWYSTNFERLDSKQWLDTSHLMFDHGRQDQGYPPPLYVYICFVRLHSAG